MKNQMHLDVLKHVTLTTLMKIFFKKIIYGMKNITFVNFKFFEKYKIFYKLI